MCCRCRVRVSLLLPFVVLVLGLSGCSDGTTRWVGAKVLFVEGSCAITHRETAQRGPLELRASPRAGDLLETESNGRASLAPLPNLLVDMEPSTTLAIVTLSLSKDGNETGEAMRWRIAHIQLHRGAIAVSHERRDVAAEPRLTIETQHGAAISSYDCLFKIEADETRTRLICATGYVYFRPLAGGNEVRIKPGFISEWTAAGASTAAAEKDSRSQQDIVDLIQAQTRLFELRTRVRNALPDQKEALEIEQPLRGLMSKNP